MSSFRKARLPTGIPDGKSLLDGVNRQILKLLEADPRLPASELARRIGMSAPAVRERVSKLEETGVIRGYRLDIDPAVIGLPVAAWVRVRPSPGQLHKVAELAEDIAEISECHRISGEDCFLLKVHVPAIEDLESILDRLLLYGQTTSSFVVSTPVRPRNPALPPGADE